MSASWGLPGAMLLHRSLSRHFRPATTRQHTFGADDRIARLFSDRIARRRHMVYWALYKDLKKKIPELDDIITGHAHILTGSTIYSSGGLHDILFLLKSFDLDIRMGYPLGTVFAYGLDEELKAYSYIVSASRPENVVFTGHLARNVV